MLIMCATYTNVQVSMGSIMRDIRDNEDKYRTTDALPTAMTREQAQAEAVRRWGEEAIVSQSDGTVSVNVHCATIANGGVKGSGPTWEAAFADADRRERAALPAITNNMLVEGVGADAGLFGIAVVHTPDPSGQMQFPEVHAFSGARHCYGSITTLAEAWKPAKYEAVRNLEHPLPVPITPIFFLQEGQRLGAALADALNDIDTAKAEIARLERIVGGLRNRIAENEETLRRGTVVRPVACEERRLGDGSVVTVRVDTGERVEPSISMEQVGALVQQIGRGKRKAK